jgi:hypothetical protein
MSLVNKQEKDRYFLLAIFWYTFDENNDCEEVDLAVKSSSPLSSKRALANFKEFESELADRSLLKKIRKRLSCKKSRRISFRGPCHGLDFYFK